MNFPYGITPVDPVSNERLLKDFIGEKDGFIQVGPKKYFFPSSFANHAEQFYNFEARPDDIWICTFPRSGTTLTQELVWLIANDFDYVRAQRESLLKRFPMFESCMLIHKEMQEQYLREHQHDPSIQTIISDEICAREYEALASAASPRFIKTHLPFSLLPPSVMKTRAKIIYVARNPKDVAVSWFHLCRFIRHFGYINDFSHFWDYFEKDLTLFSPYWKHIKECWEHRHDSNVLFLFYEDLIKDLPANISKVATFLHKNVDKENTKRLVDHLSLENFRNNQSVNWKDMADRGLVNTTESPFVRRGETTDGWQPEYTPEVAARANAWIEKNLQETTLRFPQPFFESRIQCESKLKIV